jgi:hypothetical protein
MVLHVDATHSSLLLEFVNVFSGLRKGRALPPQPAAPLHLKLLTKPAWLGS